MIRDERSYVEYFINEGDSYLPIRCRFLRSGMYLVSRQKWYTHLRPTFNRIFLFKHGSCRLRSDGDTRDLRSEIIYMLPVDYSFEATYAVGTEFYYFHVNAEDLFGKDIFSSDHKILVLHDGTDLFERITDNYGREDLQSLMRWQMALSETVWLFAAPKLEELGARWRNSYKYHELLGHINRNCSQSLRVADLAEVANMTPEALSKGFRRHIGMSLKTYIVEMLMQRGRNMLIATDNTVCEVAYELGYDDPLYFHRVFKKHVGVTPGDYRKIMRNR